MSGQGTNIDITPSRLETVASMFNTAAQETVTLLEDHTRLVQQLIGDMSTELRHSPVALDQLCYRWRDATISLSNALEQVAKNLTKAAIDMVRVDESAMQ